METSQNSSQKPSIPVTALFLNKSFEYWFSSWPIVFFILAVFAIAIYSNTLESAFHFDDFTSIVNNSNIKNLWGIGAIWNYWPTRFLAYLSIAANYALDQNHVFGYHLFNLIVHLGSSILVWRLVVLTFSTPAFKDSPIASHAGLLSLFIALIFSVHPIQTQAVTYIIQRTTSLAALFYLAAVCLYARSRLLEEDGKRLSKFYYKGSLIAVVLAMFTKEMAITVPFMILLYEFYFLRNKKGVNWRRVVPFFACFMIIPLTMFLTRSVDFLQMRRAGEGPIAISLGEYLLTQFKVLLTYIRLLFLPIHQNLDYDYPIAKSLIEPSVFVSLLILIAVLVLAKRLFSKYRIISFGIFWFFLTLLPESSVIPIRDVIFEHRLYLPMLGFGLFFVSSCYYIFKDRNFNKMIAILVMFILACSVLTYKRNAVWQNNFTLWEDVINKSPVKARAYNDRGNAYALRGSFEKAIADYNKVIEIDTNQITAYKNGKNDFAPREPRSLKKPDFYRTVNAALTLAIAYSNRGLVYMDMENFNQAISDFNKAIEIDPFLLSIHCNRGVAYEKIKDYDRAIADFNKEIELDPRAVAAYKQRGIIYSQKGRFLEAISDFNKVIEFNTNDAGVYNNRGNAYSGEGNFGYAIADYTKAIAVNPYLVPAYVNRAKLYYKIKEYDKCWKDVVQAQKQGFLMDPEFMEELKKILKKGP